MGSSCTSEDVRILHKLCREGRLSDILKAKISSGTLNVRSSITGRTALHEACASGQREIVEHLLLLGAKAHQTTYLGGDTALHLAVSSGERPLVFQLLRRGCDPNLPNKFGATCFHYAGDKPAIAKLLLRYGGQVSMRDHVGKSVWDYVHEACPDKRELNRLMKEAFDLEEGKRLEEAHAIIKDEEDHANAKRKAANAARQEAKTASIASAYKAWRSS